MKTHCMALKIDIELMDQDRVQGAASEVGSS
jgi:hypothetical protein